MKKFLAKLAILLIVSTQFAAANTAFSESTSTSDGDLSLSKCFSSGGFDFVAFMQSATFVDGFNETMLQPWVDVFARNQCQALDLIALIDQQDSVKGKIRDAFLSCSNDKIPELKLRYYELTAEIYYARHLVDAENLKGLTKDTATDPGMLENVFLSQSQIYSEMKEKYVSGTMFNQADFDDFFNELVSKYQDRKYDYVVCEGGSWSEVAEKWEEFKANFSEDALGFKEFGEGVAGEWKNITEEVKTMRVVKLLKDNDTSFASFMGSFIDASVNGLNIDDFADEFAEDAMKNIPTFNISSQRDMINNIQSTNQAFKISEIEKKMKADFVVLYGTTGDESIELFLNNLDGRGSHLEDTEGLIEITENSYPNMTKMQDDIDVILGKQCQ